MSAVRGRRAGARNGVLRAVAALLVLGTPLLAVATGSSAEAAVTSGTVDSAVVDEAPGSNAGYSGQTFRFDDSARMFQALAPGRADRFDVALSDGVHQADITLGSVGGPALVVGHYDDDAAGPVGAPPMDVSVDALSCGGASVIDIRDIAHDSQGVLTRLDMTFSHSCGTTDTVVGEVRYHEPALPDATVRATPARVDIGRQDVGHARDVHVRWTNTSGQPLTVASVRTTGPFQALLSDCPAVLAPGGSCTVPVRFRPTAEGQVSGVLVLRDGAGQDHAVPLSGAGRSGFTGLVLQGGTGDAVTLGNSYRFTQVGGSVIALLGKGPTRLQMRATGPGVLPNVDLFDVSVSAPPGTTFAPGTTFPVQQDGYATPPHGGLLIYGDGRGCEVVGGEVYTRTYDTTPDGRVLHADLLVRQLCRFSTAPLYGEIAYSAPPFSSPIERHWTDLGGAPRWGLPLGPEHAIGPGRVVDYQKATFYWSAPTSAHEVHGAIASRYAAMGGPAGLLGLPTTDETAAPDGAGRYNQFAHGSVFWSPATGAHEVHGAIRAQWAVLGWERSRLGYPTSDEHAVPGGRASTFAHGTITWTAATGRTSVTYR